MYINPERRSSSVEAAAGCLGVFPVALSPPSISTSGQGRTGITKTNGWRWLLAPQIISHTHMEPLDTLPSSAFPGHLLQCPEQKQLSGSRNSARLLAQTPPGLAPNPILPPSAPPGPGGLSK